MVYFVWHTICIIYNQNRLLGNTVLFQMKYVQENEIESKEDLIIVDFTLLLKEELMIVPLVANNREDAFEKLALGLEQHGFVKDTYLQAVKKREKDFPTGLYIGEINVAIPHTDVEHVVRCAMAVGVLENPVRFASMENPQVEIEVSIIFMLALKNAHDQPVFLQKLVGLFQDKKLLRSLASETSVSSTYHLLLSALAC
jgi:PTS system galactitol-specific IIA component